jgi:hypothetical protein
MMSEKINACFIFLIYFTSGIIDEDTKILVSGACPPELGRQEAGSAGGSGE